MIARFGPHEIAARHALNRLSTVISDRRGGIVSRLGKVVIDQTYPAILAHFSAMDGRRDNARRYCGEMTEAALEQNERDAELMGLWIGVAERAIAEQAQ